MNYDDGRSGRFDGDVSVIGGIAGDPRLQAQRGELVTFEIAQERLMDAWVCWQRMPDREGGWQHVKACWPDIARQGWRVGVDGEHDEREAVQEPRRPALTRGQMEEMAEASEWLRFVDEGDRRLVAIVLAAKVRFGGKVKWEKIWQRFGRGRPGPDGLRMRYSRAITAIAQRVNSGKRG